MLTQGSLLLGRFRIQKVLGYGGFAVTYLAADEDLQKLFAIKEYFPSEFAVAEGTQIEARPGREDEFHWGLTRFLEEARILARFQHPNIVGVSQIFEANDTAYIVLEYQSGRSLKSWLEEIGGAPDQAEIDLILAPLLDALESLHRNDVIHRDIAPDNIYIRDDGSPVLLDFGSAREDIVAKAKTVTATIKDGFSPIEQYSTRGSGQGPWTDIYALAGTLYFAITNCKPQQATERIISDAMESSQNLAPNGFRLSFLQALDWALALQPKDRPQNIGDWRSALHGDTSFDVPRHGSADRIKATVPVSKRSVSPLIAASVFVGIIGVGTFYAVQANRVSSSVSTNIAIDPAEEYGLATDYLNGQNGRSKNEVEAVRLYRAAAEKGNLPAQTRLNEIEGRVAKGLILSAATLRSRLQQSASMTDNYYKTLSLAETLSSQPIANGPTREDIVLKLQGSIATGKIEIVEFGRSYVDLVQQLSKNFPRLVRDIQAEELDKELVRNGTGSLRLHVVSVLSEVDEFVEKRTLDANTIILRAIDGSRPWLN